VKSLSTRVCALLFAACCTPLHAADPVTWPEWPPAPRWAESRPWGEGRPVAERATFAGLDTNRDFYLSRDEATVIPALEASFGNADLDGDGRLAPLEFNNVALALAEQR
jgi:hypothetical protein